MRTGITSSIGRLFWSEKNLQPNWEFAPLRLFALFGKEYTRNDSHIFFEMMRIDILLLGVRLSARAFSDRFSAAFRRRALRHDENSPGLPGHDKHLGFGIEFVEIAP